MWSGRPIAAGRRHLFAPWRLRLRLSKLTVCGFKSFADKTEFSFDHVITGIVGPNGCGKSNVVDAIKWVLGERSSKSLRGQEMIDVIFSGWAARKPRGMASVALTFENPVLTEAQLAALAFKTEFNGTGADGPEVEEKMETDAAAAAAAEHMSGETIEGVPATLSSSSAAPEASTAAPSSYALTSSVGRRALPIDTDTVEIE